MSVNHLNQANLRRWRDELAQLVDDYDLIFVHVTHHCVSPSWDFVASGHHPSMRLFTYEKVHTELAELMRREGSDTQVGLCGLCGAHTELEFANHGEMTSAAA